MNTDGFMGDGVENLNLYTGAGIQLYHGRKLRIKISIYVKGSVERCVNIRGGYGTFGSSGL